MTYWNTKLEKIQYALEILKEVQENIRSVDSAVAYLEKEEARAAQDLIDYEQSQE